MRGIASHDWPIDVSFCRRCGMSKLEVVDRNERECRGKTGVLHIHAARARRDLGRLVLGHDLSRPGAEPMTDDRL